MSEIFGAVWEFGRYSSHQRIMMNDAHKLHLGILTVPEFKLRLERKMVEYVPELSPDRKGYIHEHALNMGARDPLKPTYEKFLPKKTAAVHESSFITLDHKGLGNLIEHNAKVLLWSAKKIQQVFRGKRGRLDFFNERRRQQFMHDKQNALKKARDKVVKELDALEAKTGAARMKWDAQVRMKQVKLRAKGHMLERFEVLKLLEDEMSAAACAKIEKK